LTLNFFPAWSVHQIFNFPLSLQAEFLNLFPAMQWSTQQKTIQNVNIMYRRTSKRWTNANERHNALDASDYQAFEILQDVMLYAFVQQHCALELFLAAVALDLHEEDDDTIFILCLLNYQNKTRMVRIVLTIVFFFMTILPEQRVPHPLPLPLSRTLASLDPSWCYRYTRFTNISYSYYMSC
jgi:hypothetical protein